MRRCRLPEDVATGLPYPVHLGFGPDGGLNITTPAIGANNGEGQILRLEVDTTPVALADYSFAGAAC